MEADKAQVVDATERGREDGDMAEETERAIEVANAK